ncbi:deoxynucleoside monophosphate kinase [Rhizobium phage vB_RleM_P10VF]|uniref:Putative deoxynucleotide monophosphate kinase n=1 Tax=Rhizobium phage vB_RleM_P10VF TaxID=1527770 RepID=A0A076YIV8_9CAUD|nr:deoxynucleoside monophosphate kinase [Rhizobium phage vB_RleM_P10VF]AIK68388.1 putative deoxynucleotide monophosphate kinase [Rhizobium phage vB_RleM_P10VF]
MFIGLIGYKNSGKTSIANRYKELFDDSVNMIGFSNPLYAMLGVLGISMEEIQDKSKREIPHEKLGGKSIQFALNSLGTDWGRNMIYKNLWVERSLDALHPFATNIADNVRFPNEYDAVERQNGILVAIINPHVHDDGTAPEKHILELQDKAAYSIYNDPEKTGLDLAATALYEIVQSEKAIRKADVLTFI